MIRSLPEQLFNGNMAAPAVLHSLLWLQMVLHSPHLFQMVHGQSFAMSIFFETSWTWTVVLALTAFSGDDLRCWLPPAPEKHFAPDRRRSFAVFAGAAYTGFLFARRLQR